MSQTAAPTNASTEDDQHGGSCNLGYDWPLLEVHLMREFERITFDPAIMGGKPCIRGMRVTVSLVLGLMAAGRSHSEILVAYPYLEDEDLRQVLEYASWLAQVREVTIEP